MRNIKNNDNKLHKKRVSIQIDNERRNDKLEWIGDKMTFDNDWPNTKKDGTVRVFTIYILKRTEL